LFTALRNQVLDLDPARSGLHPTETLQHVWGAMLETGYDSGVATVVSLKDGTTSLYSSAGFGIIGGGAHADVILATARFLAAVEAALDGMPPEADPGLPGEGQTIIRALTFDGRRAVSGAEGDFGSGVHPLSNLFYAGQAVMTELQLISDQRGS
jgi:hypothetical protein